MSSKSLKNEPRRFAPLKEGVSFDKGVPKLKGVVFDVDGTLWYVFILVLVLVLVWVDLECEVLLVLGFQCSPKSKRLWLGRKVSGFSRAEGSIVYVILGIVLRVVSSLTGH